MMKEIIDYLNELFPDPKCELNYNKDYELLIAVMLSAQTTDKMVNRVTGVLFNNYSTIDSLANAKIEDVKNIIKPVGTYNKKSYNIINICKMLLQDYDGLVPNNRKYLELLPGVGRKTTNVVLSMLFNEPYFAVDTHVSRVSVRLGIANKNDSVNQIEKKLYRFFNNENISNLHHQFVLFGRYYCKSKKPLCKECKLKDICKKE